MKKNYIAPSMITVDLDASDICQAMVGSLGSGGSNANGGPIEAESATYRSTLWD